MTLHASPTSLPDTAPTRPPRPPTVHGFPIAHATSRSSGHRALAAAAIRVALGQLWMARRAWGVSAAQSRPPPPVGASPLPPGGKGPPLRSSRRAVLAPQLGYLSGCRP